MQQFDFYHSSFLALAVILEILANILLKISDGFHKLWLGILSLLAVLGAFGALSKAVKGIDLSVAYALWGGFGIVVTITADLIIFDQRLSSLGWAGLILLLIGIVLINLA